MAHRLSIKDGKAEMAYAGETPWHGLGTPVADVQTVTAILEAARLTWEVAKVPLHCEGVEVPGYLAVRREDTKNVLGVVTNRYQPIQNAQAGEVMEALVTEGGAHCEVAGALDDGQRCWVLARIPDTFEVTRGDAVNLFALVAWGHDGKHGLAAKLTPVRVVCHNTLTAAGFGSGKWKSSAEVFIKHSAKATIRIEKAREAMGLIRKQAAHTQTAYQALVATPLNDVQTDIYFETLYSRPLADPVESYDERTGRYEARRETLHCLYQSGQGALPGTAWGAYNAVTDYLDHIYPILQDGSYSLAKVQSATWGAASVVREQALLNALALTS